MNKGLIIAIDGLSAAGKSTVGRLLAKQYNYTYIDTGAMYRALACRALQLGIPEDDESSLTDLLSRSTICLKSVGNDEKIFWNGDDLSSLIRTPQVGMAASKISALPGVRLAMVEIQRRIGRQGCVVMDGRDIGSFVFPEADKKFFLKASVTERARRRFSELQQKGMEVNYQDVLADLKIRDHNDQTRQIAPLVKAEDAISIDSTHKSVKEVLDIMIQKIGI